MRSGKFSFTNTAVEADTIDATTIAAADSSIYAIREDEPGSCTISNCTTAAFDQPELITYQCGSLKRTPSKLEVTYPAVTTNSIQYGVRLDEVLRVTDDGDTSFVEDLPLVMNLTVKHPTNGAITPEIVEQVFTRLIGSLRKEDGSMRFKDLMRSALRPNA